MKSTIYKLFARNATIKRETVIATISGKSNSFISISSNGRTQRSERCNLGSNPRIETKYDILLKIHRAQIDENRL